MRQRERWDLGYLVAVVIRYTHWLFLRNECIVSYWEKRMVDDQYRLGECPYVTPFRYRIQSQFGLHPGHMAHVGWLAVCSTLLVVWRMRTLTGKVRTCVGVLVVAIYVATLQAVRHQPSRRGSRLEDYARCVVSPQQDKK